MTRQLQRGIVETIVEMTVALLAIGAVGVVHWIIAIAEAERMRSEAARHLDEADRVLRDYEEPPSALYAWALRLEEIGEMRAASRVRREIARQFED